MGRNLYWVGNMSYWRRFVLWGIWVWGWGGDGRCTGRKGYILVVPFTLACAILQPTELFVLRISYPCTLCSNHS